MSLSKERFKVDFFIVGMQRAGTTSLSSYLREHSQVVMSRPKEPHYFSEDFPDIRRVSDFESYKNLFKGSGSGRKFYGEASTGYLQSEIAMENIWIHNPEAKIIVMLRNPVDMIHSLHAHLLYCGHEDEEDFWTAWQLQGRRREGRSLPKDPRFHPFLQYRKVASIGRQVERLLAVFPKKQVKFVLFEDFVRQPQTTYASILEFLDLDPSQPTSFYTKNENRTYSLPYYYSVRRRIPWFVRSSISKTYSLIGTEAKLARRLFSSSKPSPRLTPEQRKTLTNQLQPEVKKLSQLINWDLTSWNAHD